MSTKTGRTIGIIGFGGAGLTVLVQLIDRLVSNTEPATIHVYDAHRFGRGQAYGTKTKFHILNLDTHTMSIAHAKQDHFYKWYIGNIDRLKETFPDLDINENYPPRAVFGLYMDDTYASYKQVAENNHIQIVEHRTLVIDMITTKNGYEVVDSGGETAVDGVVLALGNMPADKFDEFKGSAGYFHSPMEYTDFDHAGDIAVIGTRLTAIDTALELSLERRTNGKILLFSRSGGLPKIIGPAKQYELKYLTVEKLHSLQAANGTVSLQNIEALFRQEIEYAEGRTIDWSELTENSSSTIDGLKSEIDSVKAGVVRPWQSVLIALYPHVPWIWSLLPTPDKQYFLKHYHSLWLSYLAAFPLKNAERIYELWAQGSLEVIGGFEELLRDDDGFAIKTKQGTYHVNTVINATGSGHSPYAQSELLIRLMERGISTPGELQDIPISVTSCQVLDSNQDSVPHLYAIGETTFGTWFATADLGQASRQAANVVDALIPGRS